MSGVSHVGMRFAPAGRRADRRAATCMGQQRDGQMRESARLTDGARLTSARRWYGALPRPRHRPRTSPDNCRRKTDRCANTRRRGQNRYSSGRARADSAAELPCCFKTTARRWTRGSRLERATPMRLRRIRACAGDAVHPATLAWLGGLQGLRGPHLTADCRDKAGAVLFYLS